MRWTLRATALALVLVLAAASADALPLSAHAAPVERSLIARIWTWAGSLLSPGLTPIWEKAGSDMDPNGQPLKDTWSDPTADEGSSMDPNG